MTITAPIILRHYALSEQTPEALSTVLLKGETVLLQTDDGTWQMRIGDGTHSIQELIDENKGIVQTYIPTQIDNSQLDSMIEEILTCNNTEIRGIESHKFFKDLARVMLLMNNIRNYNIK